MRIGNMIPKMLPCIYCPTIELLQYYKDSAGQAEHELRKRLEELKGAREERHVRRRLARVEALFACHCARQCRQSARNTVISTGVTLSLPRRTLVALTM